MYMRASERGAPFERPVASWPLYWPFGYRPKQQPPPPSSALLSPRLLTLGKRGRFCGEAAVGGGKKQGRGVDR
jgi:hypothetical protein